MKAQQREELLKVLKARFEKNMNRHKGLEWAKVQARLEANTEKLRSLSEMEETGGEPDVVGHDKKTGEYIFCDCSAESPKGRRSTCYDREGLESRKENKPEGNAVDMAAAMGIELLSEDQYRELQKLGDFDEKTSSWVKTPPDISTALTTGRPRLNGGNTETKDRLGDKNSLAAPTLSSPMSVSPAPPASDYPGLRGTSRTLRSLPRPRTARPTRCCSSTGRA
jgi:hypothetical protein